MANIYDLSDTWNDAGTAFTAIKMDVTDTASASGSLILDLLVGGASQFSVAKTGTVTMGGAAFDSTILGRLHGISAFGATLIDDADASAARTTLGLGTAATTASTDYATAAQGALADSATQPGDNVTSLGSGAATDGQVPTADGLGGIAWEDAGGGVALTISDTAPTSPVDGQEWYDTNEFVRYVWYDSASAWVQDGKHGPQGEDGADGADGADGVSPAIFYALGSGSTDLPTSLTTVPLATASKADTGYTLSSNEVTIGAALNGKWAMVTWAVTGTGATSRVEIISELQVNGTRVKSASGYTARDGTQNEGGVHGFHVLQLSTSDVLRVQAIKTGSTANLVADGTHLSIVTLS